MTEIRIQLDDAALAELRLHPRAYVKGRITEGTAVFQEVGIHLKGNYGTFQGMEGKPSLTLNFDKFVRNQKFHGLDKFHLNNSASDPSYLTELLCREVFRAAGQPAARVGHARVSINGRDAGLYVLVEGYDRKFLRRHFQNPGGNLYDSEFMHDITEPLKKSSGGPPGERFDLEALAAAAGAYAREAPSPALRAPSPPVGERAGVRGIPRLESILDLDRFHSFLALEVMLGHFDGYAMSKNNYWVYHVPDAAVSPHTETGRSRREEAQFEVGSRKSEVGIDQSLLTSAPTNGAGKGVAGVPGANRGRLLTPALSSDEEEREKARRLLTPALSSNEEEREKTRRLLTPALSSNEEEREKARGRMVFIPHGMDQMFWQPQRSLFPACKGVVAEALLHTAQGRQRHLERCASLFTNLFPRLTNRVEELQRQLRPAVAALGTNAVVQHDRAVAHLKQRIAERVEHVRQELRAGPAGVWMLKPGEETPLTNWFATVEQGKAVCPPRGATNGGPVAETRFGSGDTAAMAMWQTWAVLGRGVYRVSISVACDQPIFRGPNRPVEMRLWGGSELESESIRPDAQHLELIRSFQIDSDPPEPVLVQCATHSGSQRLTFSMTRATVVRVE